MGGIWRRALICMVFQNLAAQSCIVCDDGLGASGPEIAWDKARWNFEDWF